MSIAAAAAAAASAAPLPLGRLCLLEMRVPLLLLLRCSGTGVYVELNHCLVHVVGSHHWDVFSDGDRLL